MTWEVFCDASYFDMWCVREVGERRFGHGFHVMTSQEARGLRDLLNELPEKEPTWQPRWNYTADDASYT